MTPARWLCKKNKITKEETNRLFWFGFSPRIQNEFLHRLISKFPHQDQSTPWTVMQVYAVAKDYFNPLAFYRDPPFLTITKPEIPEVSNDEEFRLIKVKKKNKNIPSIDEDEDDGSEDELLETEDLVLRLFTLGEFLALSSSLESDSSTTGLLFLLCLG